VHACPGGCGRSIPEAKFLCNACASSVPDALVIQAAGALDAGDDETLDTVLAEAAALIGGTS